MTRARLLLLSLLALATAGCQDVVDLDLNTDRRVLVVDGRVDNLFATQRVTLTYSQPYLDQSGDIAASGAMVTIYDDLAGSFPMSETTPGSGIYEASFTGVAGRSYWVEITLDGQTYASDPEPLVAVNPILDLTPEEDDEGLYAILLDSQDPPGLGQFYQWRIFVDGVYRSKPENIGIESDEFVDGNPIIDYDIVYGENIEGPATALVWQMSISERCYRFWRTVQDQTVFVGSPFDPPPALIRSNIKNVADAKDIILGYFQVSAIDTMSVQIP